jgi:hypothetical protein
LFCAATLVARSDPTAIPAANNAAHNAICKASFLMDGTLFLPLP